MSGHKDNDMQIIHNTKLKESNITRLLIHTSSMSPRGTSQCNACSLLKYNNELLSYILLPIPSLVNFLIIWVSFSHPRTSEGKRKSHPQRFCATAKTGYDIHTELQSLCDCVPQRKRCTELSRRFAGEKWSSKSAKLPGTKAENYTRRRGNNY